MGTFKDLTGMTFGRLTVEGIDHKQPIKPHGSIIYWRCRCTCGKECVVTSSALNCGATKSCGCLNLEKIIERDTTHGMSRTNINQTWRDIKQRCYNPKCKIYPRYGGRGIKICPQWHDFQTFYNDVSQMENFNRAGYTLDRINVNGDYSPENCRWATRKEQARNRRNNVLVEYEGVEMTLAEAAEKSGINYSTLQSRYKRGKRGDELFKPMKLPPNAVAVVQNVNIEYKGLEDE